MTAETPAPSEAITQPSVEPVAWQWRVRSRLAVNKDWFEWSEWREGRVNDFFLNGDCSEFEERALPPSSEIERLTREKDDQWASIVQNWKARAETAEATIRSLEARLAEAERQLKASASDLPITRYTGINV